MIWETIGSAVGGLIVGAIGSWQKEKARAAKEAERVRQEAEAAGDAMARALGRRAVEVGRVLQGQLGQVGGPVVQDLAEAHERAIQQGVDRALVEFKLRLAEALGKSRANRTTKPETPAAMPPAPPPVPTVIP